MATERNENPFSSLGKKFRDELNLVVQQVLIKNGVDKNSDLVKSVEWEDGKSRDSLYMYVNEYYSYLSKGRKPRNPRKVPIDALIRFIKKNNVRSANKTTNQLAFAMQQSIYLKGIKGKNYVDEVEKTVADYASNSLGDFLEEAVADSLAGMFIIK